MLSAPLFVELATSYIYILLPCLYMPRRLNNNNLSFNADNLGLISSGAFFSLSGQLYSFSNKQQHYLFDNFCDSVLLLLLFSNCEVIHCVPFSFCDC